MITARTLNRQKDHHYSRPDALSQGERYLLLERNSCNRLVHETVQFVTYTTCPGTVIVLDSQDRRLCAARDHLHLPNNSVKI